MSNKPTIKPTTKFRVITQDRTSFYTTAKQIENGVGDNSLFNDVVKGAYDYIKEQKVWGVGGQFCGVFVQLDIK